METQIETRVPTISRAAAEAFIRRQSSGMVIPEDGWMALMGRAMGIPGTPSANVWTKPREGSDDDGDYIVTGVAEGWDAHTWGHGHRTFGSLQAALGATF